MSDSNDSDRYHIAVVLRALDVLETLAKSGQPMGAADIAAHLDIPRNAAFRMLTTMSSRGYVDQDSETRKYQLGLRLFQLGNAVYRARDIRRLALPVLEDLHSRYQETVNLGLLDGRHIVYVERLESPRSLRTATAIGTLTPLHCAALGKAILAHLSLEEQDRFLTSGPLEALTDKTITDPECLAQELAVIRRRGYALDEEESIAGVYCAGAPVFDAQGHVAAAVSLSGPVQRMSELVADGAVAESILRAAHQISQRLGYVPLEDEEHLA